MHACMHAFMYVCMCVYVCMHAEIIYRGIGSAQHILINVGSLMLKGPELQNNERDSCAGTFSTIETLT